MTTEQPYNKLLAMIKLLRPVQWLKNGFVFAPLLFSRQYLNANADIQAIKAFLSFCLISSAIYIFNDLCDQNEDRNHPIKKSRPLANRTILPRDAIILLIIFLFSSLGISLLVNTVLIWVILAYFFLSLAYSMILKYVAILDIMTISAGFLLRILAGSVAIATKPSHWILLCTIMISLFLGFAKRRAELIVTESDTTITRHVLKDYSIKFLDQLIAIVTGATIICYALYTVDDRTCSQEVLGTRTMIITVPSVIYGIFRYLYLMYHLKKGEDPTQSIIRDIPSLLNLLIWIVLAYVVVNNGNKLDHYLIETFFHK